MSTNRDYVAYRLAQVGIVKHSPKRFYRGMTYEKAERIRAAYFGRLAKQAELAARYGLSQSTISRICASEVWYRQPRLTRDEVRFKRKWQAFLCACVDEARAND